MNVYPFIAAEQASKHNVERACELLKISRSAYYTRDRQCERDRVDTQLTGRITAVHAVSQCTYGAPRVHAELADAGLRHGRTTGGPVDAGRRNRGQVPTPVA